MLLQDIYNKGLIHPPKFLLSNTHYLVLTGSYLYGMSSDDSDRDIVGICIPKKEDVFPHLRNEILGFGTQKNRFEQWIEHGVKDKEKDIEYDFTVYSIIKYFNLAMQNNPNTLEILFAPQECILHSTTIGNLIRENRKIFLHKGCKYKYCGYAFSQLHKAKSQTRTGKRKVDVEKYGYDRKFAAHTIRLMGQGIQILEEGDLDPRREKEKLKSIRRGEWTIEQIEKDFEGKEKYIEKLYTTSKLPHSPDEDKVKDLLLKCLEHHYGSLENAVSVEGKEERLLREIAQLVKEY